MEFLSDEDIGKLSDEEVKEYFKKIDAVVYDYIKKMVYEVPFNNKTFMQYKTHADKVWEVLKSRNYILE